MYMYVYMYIQYTYLKGTYAPIDQMKAKERMFMRWFSLEFRAGEEKPNVRPEERRSEPRLVLLPLTRRTNESSAMLPVLMELLPLPLEVKE